MNPQYIDAYDNKGIALFKDGRNNEAIGDFDNAIKINPLYVSAYPMRSFFQAWKIWRGLEYILLTHECLSYTDKFIETDNT